MNDNASPATTPAPAPAVPQPQPAPAATPPPTATVDLTPVLSAITGLTNRIIAIENRIVAPDGGVAAIRASASTGNEGPMDHVRAMKTPRERYSFMRNNWEDLRASISRSPRAANTTSSTLVTSFLTDGAITILQSRLAPLMAFALDFRTDPVKPLATMQVRKVTAGGTAQSNATDFEDTTNFVATNTHVTITPAQLTAGSHITNAEINSGHRMAHWVDVKAAEIGDKIMAAVAAVITTGNFTATPVTSVAAAFGWDELKSLWGQLKKSTIKNLILDGEYFARFIPETRENWDGTTGRLPGWDGFYLNTYWTGATANTVGFACNPQAIVVGAGPPEVAGSASQAGLRTSNFVVPGLQLTIQQNEWFSLKYRIDWATYDIVFGAAACDTTAGVLVKSA